MDITDLKIWVDNLFQNFNKNKKLIPEINSNSIKDLIDFFLFLLKGNFAILEIFFLKFR